MSISIHYKCWQIITILLISTPATYFIMCHNKFVFTIHYEFYWPTYPNEVLLSVVFILRYRVIIILFVMFRAWIPSSTEIPCELRSLTQPISTTRASWDLLMIKISFTFSFVKVKHLKLYCFQLDSWFYSIFKLKTLKWFQENSVIFIFYIVWEWLKGISELFVNPDWFIVDYFTTVE